jgi:hypothetical protein
MTLFFLLRTLGGCLGGKDSDDDYEDKEEYNKGDQSEMKADLTNVFKIDKERVNADNAKGGAPP